MTGKGIQIAALILEQLVDLLNITAIAPATHTIGEMRVIDRFGEGLHRATLNMADCFSYAVASAVKNTATVQRKGFPEN
ncbi:type II toxin-antitoxin system VapC family toxin [Brucella pseudogrignonensis]|uniref:type II toxin-antitoxin system VapC family toxin n=1 Tax=Brucella pseudogrignonensis TaxID=419475 RepID=UPI00124BF562|nr:type II toxin-antitoxin system VapC family toxin [Brucella pseudogrignonensis]KAB2684305.1 type II toxin-antitoxin system VapC family toxin [Brucella pseudogrignonensis]